MTQVGPAGQRASRMQDPIWLLSAAIVSLSIALSVVGFAMDSRLGLLGSALLIGYAQLPGL